MSANLIQILLLSFCLGIGSTCGKPQAGTGNFIPKVKMVDILADIHLAEAAVQTFTGTQRDSLAQLYYAQILMIHGVSAEEFDASHFYYFDDPVRADDLYEDVLDQLNKRDAKNPESFEKKDSTQTENE